MERGTSSNGRAAKAAKGLRGNPVAIIVVVLVAALAIYTGFVGGVSRLPPWLRPIASALTSDGGEGRKQSPAQTAPDAAAAPDAPSRPAKPEPATTPVAPAASPESVPSRPAPSEAATSEQRPVQAQKPAIKEETRPVPAGSYHAKGRVIKLLADDSDGIRHQKFLIRLPDRSTLLVVHNIDLAPRLDDLAPGDEVEVCGEFVENDRGGLVHWTHHAPPRSSHSAGWIKHLGKIYE